MTIINQKSISGITSITFASAGDDLLTFHSNNGTERFRIDNSGNTKITAGIVTTLTVTGNGTVGGTLGVTGNTTVGGTLGVTGETTFSTHVNLGDSDQLRFGASNDLVIQHNGSDSLISETGTGDLYIRGSNNIYLQKGDGSETFIATNDDGAVELYHDNVKKIDTVTGGQRIFGYLSMQGTGGHIYLPDTAELKLGDSEDLKIYHNGTNSLVDNATGALAIRNLADDQDVNLQTDDGSGGVTTYVRCDGSIGSVRLYHYGTEKAYTKSDGFDVVGELQCDSLDVDGDINLDGGAITFSASANTLDFADSVKANFGNGDDLQIYHDGTHSYINDGGTGNLKVLTTSMVVKNAADSEIMLQATQNGSVDLYYDNSKKFETLTNGVRVQGGILFGSDTADANALDDYEEGTWTPTVNTESGTAYTLSNAEGNYTRIGNLVFVHFHITFTAEGSGTITVISMPFTRKSGTDTVLNGYVTSSTNRKSVQYTNYGGNSVLVRIDDGDSFVNYWSTKSEWAPTNSFFGTGCFLV